MILAVTTNPSLAGLMAWLGELAVIAAVLYVVIPKRVRTWPRPRAVSPHRQAPTAALSWPQRTTTGSTDGKVSQELFDYYRDRIPGRDGAYWRQRTKPWKAEFRRYRRPCEIGRVLRQLGYPNCGPRPIPPGQPIHADHIHYRTLFAEQRQDVALGCESCHRTRERLKDQGINIYQEAASA